MIDNKYFVSLGPPLNITDVRLANGTGPYDGRAEIKVGNQWGTICNTNFDIIDADAFCRRLGLRQAAKSSMIYDSPSGGDIVCLPCQSGCLSVCHTVSVQ